MMCGQQIFDDELVLRRVDDDEDAEKLFEGP
jgi:hypothetical protein